jgi:hypothetical protein
MSPEEEKRMVEHINQLSDATETHDEQDFDQLDYALIERRLAPRKGRWLRFSEEQIARMNEKDKRS